MKYFSRIISLLILAICLPTIVLPVVGQDSSPGMGDSLYVPGEYQIFTGDGQPAAMEDIAAAMGASQVVFIGETHDDPTGHMMELMLLQTAHRDAKTGSGSGMRRVALSLEFFQNDVQSILDEYLDDLITESTFRADSRPWPRYESDYRPLIEYAKENKLSVIAANAPRRYTNRVSRLGRESLDELSESAKRFLPPLPYGESSPSYRDQWIQTMMSVMEEEQMKCGKPVEPVVNNTVDEEETVAEEDSDEAANQAPPNSSHGNMGNMLHSQVLWDASMAYRVSEYLDTHSDDLVLHMVGSFHVARGTGIPEHLEAYRPGTKSLIIVLRPVQDVEVFESAPSGTWGDFVIQTDESHTLEAIECATN